MDPSLIVRGSSYRSDGLRVQSVSGGVEGQSPVISESYRCLLVMILRMF